MALGGGSTCALKAITATTPSYPSRLALEALLSALAATVISEGGTAARGRWSRIMEASFATEACLAGAITKSGDLALVTRFESS